MFSQLDPINLAITFLINLGNALIQFYNAKKEIRTVRDVIQISGQDEADRILKLEKEVLELKEQILDLKRLVLDHIQRSTQNPPSNG